MNDLLATLQFADNELCTRCVLTLLHFLWQGALIGVVVVVAERLPKLRSASGRYELLSIALLSLPVCVAVTFVSVNVPAASTPVVAQTPTVGSLQLTPILEAPPSGLADSSMNARIGASGSDANSSAAIDTTSANVGLNADSLAEYSPALLTCYLLGAGFFLVRLAIVVWGGQRLRSTSTPVDDSHLTAQVARLAKKIGLKAVPLVAWCDRVAVPTVIGVIRPTILLPMSLVSGLDSKQLAAILNHELSHIRRYDLWMNLIQRLLESVLFFHPVVWYISRRLSTERESCCDDLVIASGQEPMQYAGALLRVAELCAANQRPASTMLAVDGDRPSQLEMRIERLMMSREKTRVRLNRSGAIAFTVVLALVLLSPAVFRGSVPLPENNETVGGYEEPGDAESRTLRSDEPKSEPSESTTKAALKSDEPDGRNLDPDQSSQTDLTVLKNAVRKLNEELNGIPASRGVKPLKVEDVLAVLRLLDESIVGDDSANKLSTAEFKKLKSIVKTGILPKDVRLRNFSRYYDGHTMQHGSWVRLMLVDRKSRGVFSPSIRTKKIFDRPYSQIERQQKNSHSRLIGRLITYFKDDPRFGSDFKPTADYDKLAADVQNAIRKKDADAFVSLFHFAGVKKNNFIRKFVRDEVEALLKRKVASTKFVPKGFTGNLLQWQAGTVYVPNLRVEGYLSFALVDQKQHEPASLKFEVGSADGKPRLVCYIVKSNSLKSGTKLTGTTSYSGFYIQRNDGSLEGGFNIKAALELKELERANGEIWLQYRGDENKTTAADTKPKAAIDRPKKEPTNKTLPKKRKPEEEYALSVKGIAEAVNGVRGIQVLGPGISSAIWESRNAQTSVIRRGQCQRFAEIMLPGLERHGASVQVRSDLNELRFMVDGRTECRDVATLVMLALIRLDYEDKSSAIKAMLDRESKKRVDQLFGPPKMHEVDKEGNITELRLKDINLSDGDIEAIGRLSYLLRLDLSNTGIIDQQMVQMDRIWKLVELNLSGTTISNASLGYLGALPNLQRLVLTDTKVTDQGLTKLKNSQSLRHLSLSRCEITDAGAKILAGFPRLESLKLSETKITDTGLKHLKTILGLRGLTLDATQVTPAGLQDLGQLAHFKWTTSDRATLNELVRRLEAGKFERVAQMESIGLHFPRIGKFKPTRTQRLEQSAEDKKRNRQRWRLEFEWRKTDRTDLFFAVLAVDRGAIQVHEIGVKNPE